MPVESKHPCFIKMEPLYETVYDAIEGSYRVKEAGVKYLPMLSGQTADEYSAYKTRALYFAATGRTLEAMCGMFTEPVVTCREDLKIHLDKITQDGRNFEELVEEVIENVSAYSRLVGVLDVADNGSPYLATYAARSMINWRVEVVKGVKTCVLAVFEEHVNTPKDTFDTSLQCNLRVFRLTQEFGCVVETYTKREQRGEDGSMYQFEKSVPILVRGKTINFVPVCPINRKSVGFDIEKPHLIDIAEVNLSHYRTSADLEHGRHFTALPTPWAAGFEISKKLHIGGSTAWVSEDPSARCGYLEYTGQGLTALENAQKEKQDMMAALGSRILESDKLSAESADTHKIRKSGENNIIEDVGETVGHGLELLLKWYFQFLLGTEEDIEVEIKRRQIDPSLSPQMLTALMGQVQAGLMSWPSYFEILQRGQLITNGRTKEEEQSLIEMGTPSGMGSLHGAKGSVDSQKTTRDLNPGNAYGKDGGNRE